MKTYGAEERRRAVVAVLLEVGCEGEDLTVVGEDRLEDLEPSEARVAAPAVTEDRDVRAGVTEEGRRLVAPRGEALARGRDQDNVPVDRTAERDADAPRTVVGLPRKLPVVPGE